MIESLPVVDMTDPTFWADIHTPLRTAREQHPIARSPGGELLALGYPEVEQFLRDPRMNTTDLLARNGLLTGPLHDWWSRVMFSTNPPEHTRLRRLVSRAFTPKRIDDMRPTIARVARAVLAPHLERGEIDVLHDFAHHLPIRVMGTMLAIPEEDYPRFAGYTANLGLTFSAIVDAELRASLEASILALNDYVQTLVEARRSRPGDDLLSALIAAEESGDRLTTGELVAMVENLLFAGHDTTRSFLSIAVPLLLRHPDQLRLLYADDELFPSAVEECLRYEPPVMGSGRQPTEPFEVAGVRLETGVPVGVALPAANRDPRVFRDPERFDITRFARPETDRPPAIASFGQGVHFCLGAALARAEGQIGLRCILHALPDLRLTGELRWVPYSHIRRYESVPAAFNPSRVSPDRTG
jgi:cytochrome P450